MYSRIGSPQRLLPAAFSTVMPGLGQLANGQVNKAIWLFLAFTALGVPGVALVALYLPSSLMFPALLLGLVLTLGLWVYGIADAWRGGRGSEGVLAQPWQSTGLYALVFAAGNLVTLPLLIGYVRAHQVEPLQVPSSSMAPTMLPGDYFFADKRYNCLGCGAGVSRGDIAIFAYPNDRSVLYLKRIVGLPGDHVQMRGREVKVNGTSLTLPDSAPGADDSAEAIDGRRWRVSWSGGSAPDLDITVPPGHVFVLGDNRGASTDSRRFGTVPLQDVVGKARQVWFSRGTEGVRWDRLGTVLR
jgi:signal peptidase I